MKPPSAKVYRLKDALVAAGLLDKDKAGRGKPSRLMREQAEGLVAQGWNIEGYAVNKGAAPTNSTPAPVQRVERKVGKQMVDVPDPFRDEGMFRAMVNGKEIGFRTVENQCHNSLGWCRCATPKVWVDAFTEGVVTFTPRRRKGV